MSSPFLKREESGVHPRARIGFSSILPIDAVFRALLDGICGRGVWKFRQGNTDREEEGGGRPYRGGRIPRTARIRRQCPIRAMVRLTRRTEGPRDPCWAQGLPLQMRRGAGRKVSTVDSGEINEERAGSPKAFLLACVSVVCGKKAFGLGICTRHNLAALLESLLKHSLPGQA